jgi:hypothetical protein
MGVAVLLLVGLVRPKGPLKRHRGLRAVEELGQAMQPSFNEARMGPAVGDCDSRKER